MIKWIKKKIDRYIDKRVAIASQPPIFNKEALTQQYESAYAKYQLERQKSENSINQKVANVVLSRLVHERKANQPKRKRKSNTLEQAVLDVLAADLLPVSYKTAYSRVVKNHPHTNARSVNSTLARLAREGKAERVRSGVYRRAA